MKRKPLRAIDIVNHVVHREASTGGVPALFLRGLVADAPLGGLPKGFGKQVQFPAPGKRRR